MLAGSYRHLTLDGQRLLYFLALHHCDQIGYGTARSFAMEVVQQEEKAGSGSGRERQDLERHGVAAAHPRSRRAGQRLEKLLRVEVGKVQPGVVRLMGQQ